MRSAEEAIDLLVAHGRRAGLFLDFDGTLAVSYTHLTLPTKA